MRRSAVNFTPDTIMKPEEEEEVYDEEPEGGGLAICVPEVEAEWFFAVLITLFAKYDFVILSIHW